MKIKFLAIILISFLILPGVALAQTKTPTISISQLKYDPQPAETGNYMTLWLQIYNAGINKAENVTFELIPKYPFSLDPNEDPLREYHNIPGLYTFIPEYKIRVDKDAVEGWNEIGYRYKINNGPWVEDEINISVSEPPDEAELKAFYVSTEPKPYPGGETTLSIDLANIASGSAYYTVVGAESEIAEIEVNEIFIGTMDADDFDTIDFDLEIKENVAPGKYPVKIKSYYKDSDDKRYESENVVYMKVYDKNEILEEQQIETPWYQYLAYIIVALIIIKYFITPFAKKVISFFNKKRKK